MKSPLRLFVVAFVSIAIFGCGGNMQQGKDLASAADSTSAGIAVADSVKLVKTAAIQFKVKDVVQSCKDVSSLATTMGGMIYDQSIESTQGDQKQLKVSSDSLQLITVFTPHADITARIPSANLEAFLYNAAGLGYFIGSSNLHIDDKSLDYLENTLRQKNRTDVLARAAAKPDKSDSHLRSIEVKDEVIDQQVANKAIDRDVRYSTVSLQLLQNPVVRREMVANTVIDDYQLPSAKRFGDAFQDGWNYFVYLLLALAHLWVFFLLALAILGAYRYPQLKRKSLVTGAKQP